MTPKDKIKDQLNIVDIISNYIRLERSGNQYKARCPFHNEKTPSFYVSPQRNSYHCFGCNKGGDIFSFLQEIEHIEFYEALKTLAKQAGITIGEYNKEQNDNLYEIMESSCEFYQKSLQTSPTSKKYLHDRGLLDETINEYRIGFANNNWQDLFNHLIKAGFNKDNIIASGMCYLSDNSGKVFDRWRGRIMFPIRNVSGIIVGWTGRVLPEYDDGKQGKYVNSPETKIFKKSQILFNYDKAKKYIAETREVIIAEGQMDVIMSSQAGVKNIIAISGTAFTDEHIKIIKRLADKVVLCFDNDNAGLSARNRTALMCVYGGLDIYNINIDNNTENNNAKDIADIVKNNQEEWARLVHNKRELIEDYIDEANLLSDKDRINFIKNTIIPFIKAINSPLERNRNIQLLAKKTGLSQELIFDEIRNYKSIYEGQNNQDINKTLQHIDPKIKDKQILLLEITVVRESIDNKNNLSELEKDIEDEIIEEINNNIKDIPEELKNAKSIEMSNIFNSENTDKIYKEILMRYRKIYYQNIREILNQDLINLNSNIDKQDIDTKDQETILRNIMEIDKKLRV